MEATQRKETFDRNAPPGGESFTVAAPSISLPKGGGAIRGMGEKFAANPVTGTGSMAIPIATSPGRSGFGPQLSLSYDSGAGNGPFGFGWNLSLPSITRKTDKGLPQYLDAIDSDVFVLSGAEDLVPIYRQDDDGSWIAGHPGFQRDADGFWVRDPSGDLVIYEDELGGYSVRRYRPRIEGLFARIERWSKIGSPSDVHWRSISKDNILTLYGLDANSRIADPLDASRIFSWLICESRDDKGNGLRYIYKKEDGDYQPRPGQADPFKQAHQLNRGDTSDPRRTAQRYLQRILYGNLKPLLATQGQRPLYLSDLPNPPTDSSADWLFEVRFDYGELDEDDPMGRPEKPWLYRHDAFSTYRPGFEVRTCRRCERVLMLHHIPDQPAQPGYQGVVRSTEFTYDDELDPNLATQPVYSFLKQVVQTGWKQEAGSSTRRSLPPVEFAYSEPIVQDVVEEVDPQSAQNLPIGLDGSAYRWIDLHGEGIPGILTEQAGAWFYKRNLSPLDVTAKFSSLETVTLKPNAALSSGADFMDLAGDGQPDVVVLEGPTPGLYEHDEAEGWQPFRRFSSLLNRNLRDPNLKFIDLDGDGHPDVLISEDDAFVWHPSLAEEGFGPARRVAQALDEESGPRVVFADGTQSVYVADLSGDGLSDIVRIRNGEVCYWPNLGHGHFGAKVTMDNAPWFDHPDQFDHQRIRLADIDGSGTTDIIYLHRDGVRLYFNQSGNSWSQPRMLPVFPRIDDLASIVPTDLLGNGTACLVWSSLLPGDTQRSMRYVDLMGGQKPHLLVKTVNNLGAETRIHYAPSTKFYLQDKYDGKPWITRLPFPVHVVERVETYDHISRNRFVTRYAYHHGYFDGVEREFRGFGMVEQFDTEEFASLSASQTLPAGANVEESSHVPPVLTRTWFHTGAHLSRNRISNFFAGLLDANDIGEYYREPGLTDTQAHALLLDDSVLPGSLTPDEEREACRALKGSMLRQEIYAQDGTDAAAHPYTVTEQNFTIRKLQSRGNNRHSVFFTHAREAISYHYERKPADPRIGHALTLEVDEYGNVLKSAVVGYGRRQADVSLSVEDQAKQSQLLITFSESRFTNTIDDENSYRTPLPCEMRTYELTGLSPSTGTSPFMLDELLLRAGEAQEIPYEAGPSGALEKRLIEHVKTFYRPNDLGLSLNDSLALLPLGQIETHALPGESYKLALTPGLVSQIFGTKATDSMLQTEGRYVHSDGDASWWIRSGRVFFSPGKNDDPATELAQAKNHFFMVRRVRDPFYRADFNTESNVDYDTYDLLVTQTRDALDNLVSIRSDYRVLQPSLMTDPNGNRSEVAFDILGMVAGTAVMGKETENQGDTLHRFTADLDEATVLAHLNDPLAEPHAILQGATTRLVYDLFAYHRTKDQPEPQPAVAYAMARETHAADLAAGTQTKIQHSFVYSDGFGREIQKKIQTEPGSLVSGGPEINPRWVGSGWTVFNNKGKPVRQFEPFFSATHAFEFDLRVGVSPILFYDPLQRVVGTLHPNHTWQKVVFDPWRQESWDVNDTLLINPADDVDIGSHFRRLHKDTYLPTWHDTRSGGAMGVQEQAAAQKTEAHANTPAVAHMDSLGRTFLTIAHNRVARGGSPLVDEFYRTRVVFDIEGNQREVIDALGRIVMRYDYDMLSASIYSVSMDAGERWMLNDVAGKPLRAWDSRGHEFRTEYDPLHRPVRQFVRGTDALESDPRVLNRDILFTKVEYGEGQANDSALNLRTRAYKSYDNAGVIVSEAYDFKGNLLRGKRQLAKDYKNVPDWASMIELESQVFSSSTLYNALNRPVSLISPDNSEIKPTYNEANLLERIQARLRGAAEWTTFVEDVDYNAKGQRESISYGNGVKTSYAYDPLTFRLTNLKTTRNTGGDLQHLSYTFDPAGNITYIKDAAQRTIYFANTQITPDADYTYDAINQLIQASGREHIGQVGQVDHNDPPIHPLPHPNDGEAMRHYTEQYEYDTVGNILAMIHQASNGSWTRRYQYAAENNRLLAASLPGDDPLGPFSGTYGYNAHGSMTDMPHLPVIAWNFAERMQSSTQQVVNHVIPETTYYVYDVLGQRVRKVTERQAAENQTPTRMKERIYVGGFEVYREYSGNGADVALERETLHIMDDKQRIALVETKNIDNQHSALITQHLVRYQLGNHLGSASLELDDAAQLISYEEYHPYGTTSYCATDSRLEVSPKQYRYTGKEKDEETGLYYYGARYYASWIARWEAADPSDLADGANVYRFNRNNPIRFLDPNGRGALDQMKNVAYGVSGAVSSKAQSVYQGAATLASNVYNDPTGTAMTMAKESLPGKVVTGDFSGAWNDVWEEGAYTVNNVGNLLKSGVGLYQADYIHTLNTGSQQEIQAATEKVIDDTAGMIDTGSDIISFGTKTVLEMVIKKPILKGAAVAVVGAALPPPNKAVTTSTLSPLPAEFVDNVALKPETIVRRYATEVVVNDQPWDKVANDAALQIGTYRGAPVVKGSGISRYPEVEHLTYVGHGNANMMGRKTAEDIHNQIERAGVSPDVVELAGCMTAGCGGTLTRDLAFMRGRDAIGYPHLTRVRGGVMYESGFFTEEGTRVRIPPRDQTPAQQIRISAPLKAR